MVYIFWGLILNLIKSMLSSTSVIFSIIGDILICRGLYKLRDKQEDFKIAYMSSKVLLLMDTVNIVIPIIININVPSYTFFFLMWGIVEEIIMMVLIYHICSTIYGLSKKGDNKLLCKKINFNWKFYFFANVIYLIIMGFSLNFNVMYVLPIVVMIILVSKICILILFKKDVKEVIS